MSGTVRVPLGERAYDVRIGSGLIGRAGAEIAPLLARKRVAVLTEERVAALHLPAFETALAAEGIETVSLALPPGDYLLEPQPVEGLMGAAAAAPFTVSSDAVTPLDVAYDTGIR